MEFYTKIVGLLVTLTIVCGQSEMLDTNATPKNSTDSQTNSTEMESNSSETNNMTTSTTESPTELEDTINVELTHALEYSMHDTDPLKFNKSSLDPTIGTHVIAPCMFNPNSTICVDNIPLEHLKAPAVVMDMRGIIWDNSSARITDKDMEDWESKNGKIPNGTVVLIQTGWSRYWSNYTAYRGSSSTNFSTFVFPDIDVSAATWLTTGKRILGVGIDGFSLERYNATEVHQILASQDIFVVENLDNLDHLTILTTQVVIMPLRVVKAGAAPCRAVAMVPGKPDVRQPPTTTVTPPTIPTAEASTEATDNKIPDKDHQSAEKPSSSGRFDPTSLLILLSCLVSVSLSMSSEKR